MRIALFGGTGRTGQRIIQQAREAGHEVRILARDPGRLDAADPGVEVIAGDVLDPLAVDHVVRGSDAVVISLGKRGKGPDDLLFEGTRNILDAMEREGLRRVTAITSMGVGDSWNQLPLIFKIVARTVLRKRMADKERQEALIRGRDLDWMIVRPGGLKDAPRTGRITISTDGSARAGQVTTGDVAHFIVQELDDPRHVRQAVTVT